jgi:hypothetical protein
MILGGKMFNDLLIRLRALLQRKAVESELDDELRFHFDQQVEKFVQSGWPLAEARRRARIVFGGSDQIKEECREARGIHFLETCGQDMRYGIRMLYRNAGFTTIAVLVLALGIGVNDVAFTAYRAFFKRTVEARDPGKMVNLALVLHSGNIQWLFSYPDYEAYRDRLHSFSGVIARSDEFLILSDAGGSVSQRDAATGSLGGRAGAVSLQRQQQGVRLHWHSFRKLFLGSRNRASARPHLRRYG